MFQELDAVTLIAPVPRGQIWDLPDGSPLLDSAGQNEGLLPGDIGTIVLDPGDGQAFDVEFMEPDGYTVAIATVYSSQMRPVAEGDIDHYRFWKSVPIA